MSFIVLILFFAIYCSGNESVDTTDLSKKSSLIPSAILKDLRDGNEYKIIQIGNQVWMAENLRYVTEDSYCYKNKEENCLKYGRLYVNKHHCERVEGNDKYGNSLRDRCRRMDGTTLSDSMLHICPDLFHIPTRDDWDSLLHVFKEPQKAGLFLKSENGWRFSKNGADITGFKVIPVPEDTVEPNRLRGTKSCFWGNMEGKIIYRCFNLSDSVEYWPLIIPAYFEPRVRC